MLVGRRCSVAQHCTSSQGGNVEERTSILGALVSTVRQPRLVCTAAT